MIHTIFLHRIQSPKKASIPRRLSRSASKFAANFQNNSQGNPPPVNVHTLSNPDDMSSSLLRSDSTNEHSPAGNVNPSTNFFGNFKGFSLTPVEKSQQHKEEGAPVIDKKAVKTIADSIASKSAKITPVHRSSSNAQTVVIQGPLKPVLRSAPPLPVVPKTTKVSPRSSPSIKRTNSSVQDRIKAFMNTEKAENLPPIITNPPPRPVISSPILEASTCTAKELISPLQGSKTLGPIRPAPNVPSDSPDLPKRPLSMHSAGNFPQKPLPEEPKKVKEGISLNRIASFLKPEKSKEKERNPVERSHSLPKNPNHQVKIPKIDKGGLRNLPISNPILQKQIELPVNTVPVVSDSEDGDETKSFVNRAQSMRAPASQKPVLQSFGSMRQAPGVPRPVSVVGRPTAPPPPLPNDTPVYQNPKPIAEIKSSDYVDCIEEKQAPLAHIDEESSDNIYAIIEESPQKESKALPGVAQPSKTVQQSPPEGYNTPKPLPLTSGSTESVGLLGEIVNEIQNRNFDSIYSTSTLARKKKAMAENRDSTYMNADHYKTPESVYSNSGAKSNASTTSSGYLHPSAVNVPTYLNKTNDVKQEEKTPPSPTAKANTKIPTISKQVTPPGINRQTTPPGLKTTTFRSAPQSPKNIPKNVNIAPKIANSPDVVSSCAVEAKNVKPPDVINNNKVNDAPKVAIKPNITNKPSDNRPPLRPAPAVDKKPSLKTTTSIKPVTNSNTSLNKATEKTSALKSTNSNSKADNNVKALADNLNKNKPKVVPKPSAIVQRTDSNVKSNGTKLTSKPSNVASLQQKFENRKSIVKEISTAKK